MGYSHDPTRDVIVAKTAAIGYVALQAPCPHQGTSVYPDQGQGRFSCPNHNAVFAVGGAVLSGPSPCPLKQHTVAQTATSLRVTDQGAAQYYRNVRARYGCLSLTPIA